MFRFFVITASIQVISLSYIKALGLRNSSNNLDHCKKVLLFVLVALANALHPQHVHHLLRKNQFPPSFSPENPQPALAPEPSPIPISISTFNPARIPTTTPPNYKPNQYELEQNRAANYKFSSNIEDHISDLNHQRDEVREGLNVKGSYSYSDGYVKRTVHYEADEKGYRVVGQEISPLDGPKIDLTGSASVDSAAHGSHISYRVQSVPIPGPVAKIIDQA